MLRFKKSLLERASLDEVLDLAERTQQALRTKIPWAKGKKKKLGFMTTNMLDDRGQVIKKEIKKAVKRQEKRKRGIREQAGEQARYLRRLGR